MLLPRSRHKLTQSGFGVKSFFYSKSKAIFPCPAHPFRLFSMLGILVARYTFNLFSLQVTEFVISIRKLLCGMRGWSLCIVVLVSPGTELISFIVSGMISFIAFGVLALGEKES